jgi:hypothetical protein
MIFIKNQNNPLCKNCKHYIPPTKHTPGKCSLFGEQNLETGEIEYMKAIECRKDFAIGNAIPFAKTCGAQGIYYEISNAETNWPKV